MRPKPRCAGKQAEARTVNKAPRKDQKQLQQRPRDAEESVYALSKALVPGALVVETEEFRVEVADAADASEVQSLYAEYVGVHQECYSGHPVTETASFEDWAKALSAISFDEVLTTIQASVAESPLSATDQPTAVAANKAAPKKRLPAEPVPGVLKCTQRGAQDRAQSVVGYLLYELREKGEKKKKQRFCEIVNLVVSSHHRGASRPFGMC
mmetsp:Transcript_56375/g.126791  ORF Transcript_56375/g.126791 Transcript_56375/m.126791 type:complete len:211 (-) Transcript_56375:301-933(-)